VQQLIQACQRFLALEARLPAVLKGADKPASATEQIEFAGLCLLKKDYPAAASFYLDAFTAQPKLAKAVLSGHRYTAARAAALAGCGKGEQGRALREKQRLDWRQHALDWLRADLAWWGQALDKTNAQGRALLAQQMENWQREPDLAGVRDKADLAKLPEDERK